MIDFHSLRKDLSEIGKAVFEIELEEHDNVYMSVTRSNYLNEERFIILLDAQKFLYFWKNDPSPIHSSLSNGNVESWKKDEKYNAAARGFSYGKRNPVPLADIVCNKHTIEKYVYHRKYLIFKQLEKIETSSLEYISFINGVSRTIWLLSHGAKYFPVECRLENNAERLAEIASYSDQVPKTVAQLLPF